MVGAGHEGCVDFLLPRRHVNFCDALARKQRNTIFSRRIETATVIDLRIQRDRILSSVPIVAIVKLDLAQVFAVTTARKTDGRKSQVSRRRDNDSIVKLDQVRTTFSRLFAHLLNLHANIPPWP